MATLISHATYTCTGIHEWLDILDDDISGYGTITRFTGVTVADMLRMFAPDFCERLEAGSFILAIQCELSTAPANTGTDEQLTMSGTGH